MKNLKLLTGMFGVAFYIGLLASEQIQVEGLSIEQPVHVTEQKIQIFGYVQCPYFAKVAYFVQSQNLLDEIEFVDVSLLEHAAQLRSISGKTQVPYLVDAAAGIKMHESDDIIAYLMKKYEIVYAKPAPVIKNLQDDQVSTQKSYDPKTFLSDIQQSSKPVVMLVSTTWCPPCKVFKPIFLQVAQKYADVCDFICVDGDANYEILIQLGIRSYPTIVCFKEGKQINPQDYRSQEGLTQLVQQLVKK